MSALNTALEPGEEVQAASRPRPGLRMDWLLLLAAFGLVGCSVLTLHSAVRNSGLAERQAIYAGMGLIAVLILSRLDYSRLREYKLGLFGIMVALNLVVYGMPAIQGAHRWIPLKLMQFQSSEFGKILLIIALSAFAVDRARRLDERRTTARIMLLALVAAMLVIPQPDLGTGMVYVSIGVAVLFFAGTSWTHLTTLIVLFVAALVFGLVVGPALGVHPLSHYQEQRLFGFLNPSSRSARGDLQHPPVADRDRLGREDRTRHLRHPDDPGLPLGQLDRLRVRLGGGDLRVRRRGGAAVAVRAAHLAHAADPHHGQEPVRHAHRGRDPGHVHVPDLRQHRHDHRHHADHRGPATPDELRRLLGDRHHAGRRIAAVDPRPGAGCLLGQDTRATS